jgi:hypothetical protein
MIPSFPHSKVNFAFHPYTSLPQLTKDRVQKVREILALKDRDQLLLLCRQLSSCDPSNKAFDKAIRNLENGISSFAEVIRSICAEFDLFIPIN